MQKIKEKDDLHSFTEEFSNLMESPKINIDNQIYPNIKPEKPKNLSIFF